MPNQSNNLPLVTIITPTYNRRELLSELIDSVRGQTLTSWELIIIDDGSTDETESYITSLQIPNVYFIKRSNITASKGPQVCRNIGIRLSKGKYLIFLDSDDVLFPTCLENRCSLMEKRPDLDFAVFWAVVFKKSINEQGTHIWGSQAASGNTEIDEFLRRNFIWQTSGPIWRRSSIIEKQGYWDEELPPGFGDDHEYHVRALCGDLKFFNTGSIDYGWRLQRDPTSLSSFECHKTGYSNGSFISVYAKLIKHLIYHRRLTLDRKYIIKKELVRLGILSRLNGGKYDLINKIISIGKESKVINYFEILELKAAFSLWRNIFNVIPSMTYLVRRYKPEFEVLRPANDKGEQ